MSAGEKISVREKIGYSLGDAASHIVFDSSVGNDSNLLIVFYVQILPDDFVMQLHRF